MAHKQLYRSAVSNVGKKRQMTTKCQRWFVCGTGSVRSCGRLLWGSGTTADGNACCPNSSYGTADMATVAPGNWPQDSRGLRDGATVCQSPTRWTGHLHLQGDWQWCVRLRGKKSRAVLLNVSITCSLSADIVSNRWHSSDGAWQHTAWDVTPSFTVHWLSWPWRGRESDKIWAAADQEVHPGERPAMYLHEFMGKMK